MGFLVYSSGIAIPYYAADFHFFKKFLCSDFLDRFLGKGRGIGSARAPHIATIALHSLLAYLVFVVLLRTGFSAREVMRWESIDGCRFS
jgi:hypothetical protein